MRAAAPAHAVPDPEAVRLGRRIRRRRQAAGTTLQALADEAGVSRSLLSQVERGLATPSLTTLRGVAAALGTPLAAFFGEEEPRPTGRDVVRRWERSSIVARSGEFAYELLTPDVDREIEFLWAYFEPGCSAPEDGVPSSHRGEEAFVCVRGSIVLTIDGEELVLEEGDSISFDCSKPHTIVNRGTIRAELVVAITPPSY